MGNLPKVKTAVMGTPTTSAATTITTTNTNTTTIVITIMSHQLRLWLVPRQRVKLALPLQ